MSMAEADAPQSTPRRQSPSKKSSKKSSFTFLFNREAGTCLGRTGKSWLQLTMFYLTFYTCLGVLWIACVAIFVQTLSDKAPKYYGKGSLIGTNPGMGYQPWLKKDPESTLVRFNVKDPKSYEKYINALEEYLFKYKDANYTRRCRGNESNADDTEQACRFDLDQFREKGCSAEQSFGYANGTPCVIVTLNRLIGWTPVAYPKGMEPEEVKGRYRAGDVAIRCNGAYEPDVEHIGIIENIPEMGIPGKFYPYKVMKNYHQPFAMVKFSSLKLNTLVMVACKAYASNILQDNADRLGLVRFELLIESKSPDEAKKGA
uniref:Sodium/potassium-transporting ATPase subunit beta n=1 Tax=Plectus sambesii TaxID=2011161 RepID=A0A914W1K3_9BILA